MNPEFEPTFRFPTGFSSIFWTNRRSGSAGERMILEEDLVTSSSQLPDSKDKSSRGLIGSASDSITAWIERIIAAWASISLFWKVWRIFSVNEYCNFSLTTLSYEKLGLTLLAKTWDSKIGSSSASRVTFMTILSTISLIWPASTHSYAFDYSFLSLSAALHFRICTSTGKLADTEWLISNESPPYWILSH